MSVLQGEVYDIAVDIRRGLPTFGNWTGVLISSENTCQLYVPEGFAHGLWHCPNDNYYYSGTSGLKREFETIVANIDLSGY